MTQSFGRALAPMTALVQRLRARFEALSPRERALGALLIAAASSQLFFAAADWSDQTAFDYADARAERTRLEALAAAANDDTVAALVRRRIDGAREWVFVGPTIEIARVGVQRAIRSIGEEAGIARLNVRLLDADDRGGDFAIYRFSIEGQFDWDSFLAFADGLSRLDKGVRIEAFAKTSGRTQFFRAILSAPATTAARDQQSS